MRRWLLVALALAPGCKRSSSAAAGAAGAGVEVDGAVVATVRPDDLGDATPLADLLPEPARALMAWRSLRAQAPGSREIHIERFGERMGDGRVLLRRDGAGGVRLEVLGEAAASGVPRQVAAIADQPIAALDDVRRIEVTTRAAREQAAPPAPSMSALELRIEGRGRISVTPEELAALSIDGPDRKQRGAPLAAVIARHVRLDEVVSATLQTSGGQTLALSRADLTGGDLHLLRHNRRGEVRYHHFPAGSKTAAHDLRGVTRIELK